MWIFSIISKPNLLVVIQNVDICFENLITRAAHVDIPSIRNESAPTSIEGHAPWIMERISVGFCGLFV